MLRFANIEYLYIGIPVEILIILGYFLFTSYKRRQLKRFGDPELIASLMPNASRIRPAIKFATVMVALTMLLFAAARPQLGIKKVEEKQRGIEAMVALDISNSMLAEDVSPCRLERAKQIVSKLVDDMSNDRVGLVIFAGDAFTQLPITTDFTAAKMFLQSITPDLIRTQGTAIGAALDLCIADFGEDLSNAGRAIIIITDGENHEDDAVAAAVRAKNAGIRVIVVGIGDPEGTTIPLPGNKGYMKDRQGNLVVTKLSEEMCQQIAEAGAGIYVHCDNSNNALQAIRQELNRMETEEFDGVEYQDYDEQFASFGIVALVLLLIEFFVFNRKNKLITKMDMFGEKTLCLAVLLTLGTSAFAQRESREIRSGNSYYKDSVYDAAALEYKRALQINPDNYAALVNLGNALYREAADTTMEPESRRGLYHEAIRHYGKAARLMDDKHADNPALYAKAKYNEGNCYKQLEQLADAAESYKEALRKNPKDEEARRNLAKIMQLQQQQQQQQDQQQQDQQKQQQQQQQQQEEQKDEMNQEAAAMLLQALEEDQRPPQQQGQKRQIEKNW